MQRISLAPVDGVHITTLMDNSSDALLPDEGLVRRWGLFGTSAPLPVLPTELAVEGHSYDFLRAEHGFSALVEVRTPAGGRRILFDTGIVPRTVTALAAEAPQVVVPGHCTSWKANQALAAGLPDAYRPNAVGSRFEL